MKSTVVILHNIRSLHNVGSIFRTADGAGISKMFLTGITPGPIDRFGSYRKQITKVSLGAEKNMPWEYHRLASHVIKKLKREGYAIFALEQSKKSIPYNKIPKSKLRNKKICLIVGNEVKGIPSSVLKTADRILEIPMNGNKESLNVSVAFGIAVYELMKNVKVKN